MSEDFRAQLAGFRAGSLVADYRLETQVGAGGMAVVFRARDERLGRLVALKILTPVLAADRAFRRRFIAESRLAAVVDDPHIIPVHEVGEADGVLFIAMQFVQGGDLRRLLERAGALPPGRAADFISPVASALDAAHRAGLVHRDVKPANILVDGSPDQPDHVYLSDFGVSKGATASVSLTGTGQFLGTPDYSAPEQIQGRVVDGRADQYALACVAYQLLTGSAPFERDQGMAVLLAHLSESPPSLRSRRPDLPAAADRVLARALAKVPEERYGSCVEFADELREALGLEPYRPRGLTSGADHAQGLTSGADHTQGLTSGADHTQGLSSGPDHAQTRMVPPPPEFGVPADPAAAPTPAATPTAALPVTATAPPPPPPPPTASSAAGQTEAEPDVPPATFLGGGEQGAMPPPQDDHPRVAWGGPAPGRGVRTPRAARPRRGGRGPVIIAATAIGVVVIGLVIAITTSSATPSTSSSGPPGTSVSGPPGTSTPVTPSKSVRWAFTTAGPVYSSPAVSGGTVYVGSADDKVYALDAATGHLRWSYLTGGPVNSSPVVAAGTVYVGSWDDKMYALNAATGHLLWSYTAGKQIDASAAVVNHIFYVSSAYTVYIGSYDDNVYALDAATGHIRWVYITQGPIDSTPAVVGGIVYIGSNDGNVYALDASSGHLLWSHPTGGPVDSSPTVAGGVVFVGSNDDKVYALGAAGGHLRWSYTTGGQVWSSPAVAGGIVYVGSTDGNVYALTGGS